MAGPIRGAPASCSAASRAFDIHTNRVYARSVNKRINIVLPASTVAVLDKVAPKGNRSALIDQAVRHYVRTRSLQNLRDRLKEEALTNAGRDLAMAAEWFPMEEEAWHLAQNQKKKE